MNKHMTPIKCQVFFFDEAIFLIIYSAISACQMGDVQNISQVMK